MIPFHAATAWEITRANEVVELILEEQIYPQILKAAKEGRSSFYLNAQGFRGELLAEMMKKLDRQGYLCAYDVVTKLLEIDWKFETAEKMLERPVDAR